MLQLTRQFEMPASRMLVVIVVAVLFPSTLQGQVIELRSEAAVDHAIVRLGDLAEIRGASPAEVAQLNKLELFPVNPSQTSLAAADIRDELNVMGVDLLRWSLSGASSVRLVSGRSQKLVGSQSRISQPNRNDWSSVRVQSQGALSPTQQATTASESMIQLTSYAGEPVVRRKPVEEVTAWTVTGDLDRGIVISEANLEPVTVTSKRSGVILNKEEIIGKVVRNRLRAGQPILSNAIEAVKFVQRGKEVRIISKVDFLQVSTFGRSLSDATLGQTVAVESLDRKKRYYGQVTGFEEVTINNRQSSETIAAGRIDNTPVVGRVQQRPETNGYAIPATSTAVRSNRLPGNALR